MEKRKEVEDMTNAELSWELESRARDIPLWNREAQVLAEAAKRLDK